MTTLGVPHSGITFTSYLDPLTKQADIHDLHHQKVTSVEVTLVLILALVIGGIDLFLLWMVQEASIPPLVGLLLHLFVIAIAGVFTRARSKAGMDTRVSAMALLVMLFTGFIGAFGTVVMIVSNLLASSDSLSFSEWFQFIYPRPEQTLGETLYDGISLQSDEHPRRYDVMPFIDVMRLGTTEQKREAMNQMVLHFQPSYAPAFQMALKDRTLSVRTLAATSVARLEKHLQHQERKLQLTLDRAEQTPELLLAAAQFYDDYAFSGILDSERKQRYVKLAYDYYQRYLRRRSGDGRASVWIGRLLIRSGQYERAADWLKQMIDEGRTDAHMLGWYAEVLYQLKDFVGLRKFMRDYAAKLQSLLHEERYSPLASSIQLWLNRSMEVHV